MNVNLYVWNRTEVPDLVKMKLPLKKAVLWERLWETKVENLNDCKVSDAETGIDAVDSFLSGIDLYRVDIFELNAFARKLESMQKRELEDYCSRLEREHPDSLEKAIYSMDTEVTVT